ncbi:Uncharacterised protein [Mycobacteroides abscessus subsp. abscessus]|nr:Uncharacterised protein [Mycobacteroides abscessus subsp. abscessus]
MMHLGKNAGIFVNGTVLDKAAAIFKDAFLLLEAFGKEINLQMEAPPVEICIKFVQVRIGVHFFK